MDKGNITGLLNATAGGRRTQMDKAQIKAEYGGWDGKLAVGMRFVERGANFLQRTPKGGYYSSGLNLNSESLKFLEVIAIDELAGTVLFAVDEFIFNVRKNNRRYATWERGEKKSWLRKDGLLRCNDFLDEDGIRQWVPFGDFYWKYLPEGWLSSDKRAMIKEFIEHHEAIKGGKKK